jgi:hypothetical protein
LGVDNEFLIDQELLKIACLRSKGVISSLVMVEGDLLFKRKRKREREKEYLGGFTDFTLKGKNSLFVCCCCGGLSLVSYKELGPLVLGLLMFT